MSQSTMSKSSSSRTIFSANESGYVTTILRHDPLATVEVDPSEDTRDTRESHDSSSDNALSQQHGASPTSVIPQPPLSEPRIRHTARKNISMPMGMTYEGVGASRVGPTMARPDIAGSRVPLS